MRLANLDEVAALASERLQLIYLYRLMSAGLVSVDVEYVDDRHRSQHLPEQIYAAVQRGALAAYLDRLTSIHRRLTDLGVAAETITLADLGDPSTRKEPCS